MFTIRPAEARDAEALWRVEAETTHATFRGLMSEAHFRRLWRDVRANRWPARLRDRSSFTFVAEADGRIVGYAMGGAARPLPVGWEGELYLLYVLPAYQRRGIGRALVLAAGRRFAEQGTRSVSVWSLANNEPSRRFYEALGAAFVERRTMREWRAAWPIAVYGWKPLSRLFAATGEPMPAPARRAAPALRLGSRLALAAGGLALMGAATLLGDATWLLLLSFGWPPFFGWSPPLAWSPYLGWVLSAGAIASRSAAVVVFAVGLAMAARAARG